jgi:hypothetical protein
MGDRRPGRRLLADGPADAAATMGAISPAARQRFLQGLPARIAALAQTLAAATAAAAPPPLPFAAALPAPACEAGGPGGAPAAGSRADREGAGRNPGRAPQPGPRPRGRPRGRPPVQLRPPAHRCADGAGASDGGPGSPAPAAPSRWPGDSDPPRAAPLASPPGPGDSKGICSAAAAAAAAADEAGSLAGSGSEMLFEDHAVLDAAGPTGWPENGPAGGPENGPAGGGCAFGFEDPAGAPDAGWDLPPFGDEAGWDGWAD